MDASLKFLPARDERNHRSVVICLNPAYEYQVYWNKQIIIPRILAPGLLDVPIPARDGSGSLVVGTRATH